MSANERVTEVLANCLWWMDKGPNLPPDDGARMRLWKRERMTWLNTAERLIIHLDHNGIDLQARLDAPRAGADAR